MTDDLCVPAGDTNSNLPLGESRSVAAQRWGMDPLVTGLAGEIELQLRPPWRFREDKAMIEAQQRLLDRHPDTTMHPVIHDRGPNLILSIMERIMREEV